MSQSIEVGQTRHADIILDLLQALILSARQTNFFYDPPGSVGETRVSDSTRVAKKNDLT